MLAMNWILFAMWVVIGIMNLCSKKIGKIDYLVVWIALLASLLFRISLFY